MIPMMGRWTTPGTLILAVAMSITWGWGDGVGAAPATVSRSVKVGSLQRTYWVHVPAAFPQGRATGLVFALHGGGGDGKSMEGLTGFSTLADREGFITVYPDAVDRNWNDGREAESIPAQRTHVDDVGFIATLAVALMKEYGIDARRVYSTGISNGAFMSQRLAIELSERIAAIAPVVGGLAPQLKDRFTPTGPVSVLVMNGTEDPLVPYQGGPVARRNRGETISIAEIVTLWVTHNRCPDRPEVVLLPDRDPSDGTRVRRTTYGPCAGRSAVVLYTIEGGGHTWAGGSQYLPRALIGRTSRDIDATRVIWEFFTAHPRS